MTNFKAQYARLGMKVPKTTNAVEKAELIFVACCKKIGVDPLALPDVSLIREKYRPRQIGDYKLMIIRDALTEEKEANWNDRNEYKYDGWFYLNAPGFRFFVTFYSRAAALTGSGSRLCTFSEEDQEFFMKEPIALWADSLGGKLPE